MIGMGFHGYITTLDVFRRLGIDPEKDSTWAVGRKIEAMWRAETGTAPPKDNRKKTNGSGSHCFAHYPPSWYERIKAVVLACEAAERRQQDLFGGE